jgi:hypothetical protein
VVSVPVERGDGGEHGPIIGWCRTGGHLGTAVDTLERESYGAAPPDDRAVLAAVTAFDRDGNH